jgi:hypothetical protein
MAMDGDGWLGRLNACWTDGTTWSGIAYLLVRFPLGTLTFSVAVAAYSAALWGLAAPILAPLDAMDLGFWEPDSVLEAVALVPLGAILLVTAGWISEGMAAMSRALIRLVVRRGTA